MKTDRAGVARSVVPLALAVALALPAALLCACAGSTAPPAPVAQRVIEKPGRSRLDIAEVDAGAKIFVDRAQTLVIDLPLLPVENREWSLVDMKPGVLTLVGSRFERDNRDRDGIASPGEMLFQFTPQAAGEVELNFSLRRPRSLEPATKIVTFSVTVR